MKEFRIQRCLWLASLIYLSGEKGISRLEINRKWRDSVVNDLHETEIPRRTFNRYKTSIEIALGVTIGMHNDGYRYYITNPSAITRDPMKKAWIESISCRTTLLEGSNLRHLVSFEKFNTGAYYLDTFFRALNIGSALLMTYQKFTDSEPKVVKIKPIFLKQFWHRWYVIGLTEEHNTYEDMRIYAFDRILDIEMTDESYYLPENINVEVYFKHQIGIFRSGMLTKLRIKVDKFQRNYWRTVPKHSSQREVETTDDYSIFELTITLEKDLDQVLISDANHFEVLSPEEYRLHIRDVAYDIYTNHKD